MPSGLRRNSATVAELRSRIAVLEDELATAQDNADSGQEIPDAVRLVRFLPDAVMVHCGGRIVFANNAAARLLRAKSPEQLTGLDILSFVPSDERAAVRERTRPWLEEQVGSPPLRHKSQGLDGSIIDVETTALAMDWNGQRAVIVVSRDLSERFEAEAALYESEDRYRRLVELMPDAMYIHDGTRIVFVNAAGVRDFGAANAGEVVSRSPLDFCRPDERELIATRTQDMLESQQGTLEFRRRHRLRMNGSEYVADVAALHLNWQGKHGILVVVRDVTEQVRAAEELERSNAELLESEERNRHLVELLPDAVYIHDGKKILFINPSGVAMFGATSADEIVGRPPLDFSHPSDQAAAVARSRDVLDHGVITAFQRRRRLRLDGSEYLADVAALHINWRGSHAVLAVVRDVTEQVRAAEELRRSNAELEQFAYVASHDLQEPLRTISSYCQLLERRYKDKLDQTAIDYIDFAVAGAKRMQLLISDLLQLSRVGTRGKAFTPTDCNEVFSDAVSNLTVAIQDSGASVTSDALPVVNGDKVQLGQLFQNLIGNAIKFRGDKPPVVHVGVRPENGEVIFAIRDNGIGIDPQHRERIFQIFQRLHERDKYPGTGIGLAVCKKIVERHGGRIWVEGAPGEGSAFLFALPATA